MDVINDNKIKLPTIIVTGASGFIGRHFVEAFVDKFSLICIARRSQQESGISKHKNIFWIQADISKTDIIQNIANRIRESGNVDYVIHLASYYDFTLKKNPEYENTNVNGTKNILELAKTVGTKRFIFSSSLAACTFFEKDTILTEESPPDADYDYAHTKRIGENMMKEYSEYFPCTVVRLAAVFSDWCEYAPLYIFLEVWLSHKWNSRILGGKGESSVTYIHINDLIKFFLKIIEKSENLPSFNVLIASPNGTVTHNDLYKAATKYYFGRSLNPIKIPKFLAGPGMWFRYLSGKFFGKETFEKPWMIKYIDTKLIVENSFTAKVLSWQTTHRYDVIRRLLFIIDKMKNNPADWKIRNEAAMIKIASRPNMIAYNIIAECRDTIVQKMISYVLSPENNSRFFHYQKIDNNLLKWFITLSYQVLAVNIKSKDRQLLRNYIYAITYRRYLEGFNVQEIIDFIQSIVNIIISTLTSMIEHRAVKKEIYDYINLMTQQTLDEIEDYYEFVQEHSISGTSQEKATILSSTDELKRIVSELEDVFFASKEYALSYNFTEINYDGITGIFMPGHKSNL